MSFKTASNTDYNTDKHGKNGKIAPSNIFESALVTKVKMSDTEVQDILDNAMEKANKYSDYNSENESK